MQDVLTWNIFTFAVFFLKCMHLHTKGTGEVKFWITLYLCQIDDPQKLAKLIIFYHLTMIVSEICWYWFRFIGLLMKLLIVPKQACNATERLPQNTALCCNLQYIVISYLEEYFSAYLHSGTLYKIVQNFKFMLMQKDLDLMRSVSVDDFKNFSHFPGYFCYKIQCDI